MSIVKELAAERRDERIEETVTRYVDDMNLEQLMDYTISQMNDYYTNTASEEEVEQFIKDNEYLPF
jgi:secreted protein with Ig-like and vWFA domain